MENNQNGESQDNLTFEKLTPTHLSNDEMKGYTEALDFVFKEDDLLNIAITGPYASGKSSVIKTYEENHQELNGIHISLSYFSPILESKIKGKKKDDELAFEDELMLERKIINQLVHQIDPDKIPATEFKVRSEVNKWKKIIWAAIISLIIFCFIYINETLFTKFLSEYTNLTLLIIFLSLIPIYYVIRKIIELQSGNNLIRKLKIFENEIDMSTSNCDVSYFDKYLNEIIYILDKSELDYIVFEDIDRYDDNLILNKLRELNYTYNKKKANNQPKPIKFIYLIKDEIFESKERTKFFDYILPIVPVMDNSNSLGKMEIIFKDKNILDDFSATFLDTLSLYLDDIRLIKNICNEYIIYKSKLAYDASWFKNKKLLAIITYKNIFPKDFSLTRLGLGQGVVHRIISSLLKQKSETYKTKINSINSEIESLKHRISIIETSHLKNHDELEALYINIPRNLDFNQVNLDKKSLDSQVELIKFLKENGWLITNGRSKDDYYYREVNCKEYFQQLETNTKYQERKKEIEIVVRNKKTTLEAEIKKLEKEKIQLKLPKKIAEIIRFSQQDGTSIESLFEKHIENNEEYKSDYKQLSSSCYFPLIRMLIIQGYIDEYYSDYTTFFDEQGLPQNDTLFLRNINERLDTPWELELKKPDIVFKKLKIEASTNFTESTILNYSLLDYILATNKMDDLSRFIHLLNLRTEADFENEYLARSYSLLSNKENQYDPKYLCLFIKKLNIHLPNIWQYIDIFDKKLYLYLSFIHNQETVLDKMNDGNELKAFIDDSTDFLLIDDEWNTIFNILDEQQYNLNKITNAFIKLNIKFQHIENLPSEILELVEKNNTYQLNQFNAKYIIENKYHLKDFDSHIIQTILKLDDDAPIKLYFENNLEESVLSLTESDVANIDDNEQTVLFILNHDEISSSAKEAYIDKLVTTISELDQITDKNIWDKLLEKQKIQYSAENIVHYFFHYELAENDEEDDSKKENRVINEQLAKFINLNDKNISSKEANLSNLITDKDHISLFFRKITINSDVSNIKYDMLISWFNGRFYVNFNYQNFEKEKISILIKYKAIKLEEKQDLNFLRENYPDNILELITYNFEDYINKIKNDMSLVNHEEIISLLSDDFTLEQKLLLVGLTSEPISINNANYPIEIQKYILDTNFDINDLAYITSAEFYYSTISEIKLMIKQLCQVNKTQILDLDQISYELLIELFTLEGFSLNEKYTLLSHQLEHLSKKQANYAFKIIEQDSTNQSFFSHLFIGKRASFENTALNKKIMEALNHKWGFTFKVEENQINANGKIN